MVVVAVILGVSFAAQGALRAAIRSWLVEPLAIADLGIATPIEDASGHALDRFHEALRRAESGEGQARVIWWGASHTAPDRYVGGVRRSFSALVMLKWYHWRNRRQDASTACPASSAAPSGGPVSRFAIL